MDSLYILIVGVLFILAISDLIVGVSNDAVNFLNSAIGSKAASFRVIMFVAALGVVVGATFSSGMMEVARKGIFHPNMFYFSEIMMIFFAVMITDVILLDTFNSLGLPTSTTVSIVFELLGAATAIALIKVLSSNDDLMVGDYINSGKALAIISGILLSVVVAFTVGAIVQYLSRLIFSFNYKKKIKYYGAIWGGISITAITYFILIKGLKGSSYANYEVWDGLPLKKWVEMNAVYVIGTSFIAWTILLQLLTMLVKLNIPRLIVFVGTFALAMAFAGNDLVNFIGVPLAGYESYLQFAQNPGADPNTFSMSGLGGKVETPFVFLLIAGLIMVATLYFSKKAKRVVKTSIDLSRQDEGEERFGAFGFSKAIVRGAINMNKSISAVLPTSTKNFIQKQFDAQRAPDINQADRPAFDMIRASMNLVIASILISFATSLKLPLSTTYVTFMVAMGTSLADSAWGRESAVYRITGVFSVIMGWFVTAMAAFTVAFIVAIISYYGGWIAVIAMILLTAYSVIHSHLRKQKAEAVQEQHEDAPDYELATWNVEHLHYRGLQTTSDTLNLIDDIFQGVVNGLAQDKRSILKQTRKKAAAFDKKIKQTKSEINIIAKKLDEDSNTAFQHYTLVLDYLRQIGHNVIFITEPALEHVDHNHTPIDEFQIEHLNEIQISIQKICAQGVSIVKENKYQELPEVINYLLEGLEAMDRYSFKQIKRLKKQKTTSKNTKLYLDLLSETRALLLNLMNTLKSQRDLSIAGNYYHDNN